MAGWVSVEASASSTTPAAPPPRRSRIARRVGSARAANTRLRGSLADITSRLYNQAVKVNPTSDRPTATERRPAVRYVGAPERGLRLRIRSVAKTKPPGIETVSSMPHATDTGSIGQYGAGSQVVREIRAQQDSGAS